MSRAISFASINLFFLSHPRQPTHAPSTTLTHDASHHQSPTVPRVIEATDADVAAKYPGHIAEIRVDESDRVVPKKIVVRTDTEVLKASLRKAEVNLARVRDERNAADAVVV